MYDQSDIPKVSLIIPTKNRCALLRETIASLCQQSYHHWEAIVVDDDSTDDTPETLLELSQQEPRLRFLRRGGPQGGAPACRNAGMDIATGDYVIFLDSDDCLAPFCLQNRIEAMQAQPHLDFAIFPCQIFRQKPGDVALLWNTDLPENDLDRFLQLDVPWQTSSPMWKRVALAKLGPWDERLLSWQDWEFHLRALIHGGSYQRFPRRDCFWRLPQAGSIGQTSRSPAHLYSHARLLTKVENMLQQAQLLNQKRQRFLAGLYFWLAERWVRHHESMQAVNVWTACWHRELIGRRIYWEGVFYFSMGKTSLLRRCIRKYLSIRWPREFMPTFSKTLRNTLLT